MFRAIGCLVVIVAGVAAGWFLRDRMLGREARANSDTGAVVWEGLTDAGAARAAAGIESVGRAGGPAYVEIAPGDLASHIFLSVAKQLPASAEDVQAAVIGDRLHVRASVRLSDLGDGNGLGPLAGMLGEREQMQMGGQFNMVRPGLGEFRVTDIMVRDFSVPRVLIPRLLKQGNRVARPPGVSEDAIPVPVPDYVADVRLSGGRVLIYRSTQ